jgi:hypothetical protein
MAPRKSTPKGIDPAYPNKNFVKTSYENKGNMEGFSEYMYGSYNQDDFILKKRASGYGHSIGQRAGKLRLSGKAGAHRVGKR